MSTRTLLPAVLLALGLVGCGASSATDGGARPDLNNATVDCNAHPELCGGCLVDADCKTSELPRCDVASHQCVPCLPTNDNCAAGTVCQSVNNTWACGPGCTGNADCNKIGGGSLCCAPRCVNPETDVTNCGACGAVCDPVSNGTPGCVSGHCVVAVCNGGFDDCDKAMVNGCETAVASDPINCGKCGVVCKPFENGLPTCTNGMCSAVCAPGFADCNKDIANGCEIDTTYDINHCGGCGKACSAPANATPFCDQSRCSFRCKLGYADCDGNPANGCEVSSNADANHCGHCGNICPLRPNSQAASCSNGSCVNSCNQGFGDCDNNAFNGCEADLSTSLAACGACGKPCSNKNAIATCSKGMCTLQCNPGFFDCNMDGKDGCEANVFSDANNCSACGMVCPMNVPFCVNGVCGNSTHNIKKLAPDFNTSYNNNCDNNDWWSQNFGIMTYDQCETLANTYGAQYMGQTGYFTGGNYAACPYQTFNRWVGEATVADGYIGNAGWSTVTQTPKNAANIYCVLAYANKGVNGNNTLNQVMASTNGKTYKVADLGVMSERACYNAANDVGGRPLNPFMFANGPKNRAHMSENHQNHGSTQYTGAPGYTSDGAACHNYQCFIGYND